MTLEYLRIITQYKIFILEMLHKFESTNTKFDVTRNIMESFTRKLYFICSWEKNKNCGRLFFLFLCLFFFSFLSHNASSGHLFFNRTSLLLIIIVSGFVVSWDFCSCECVSLHLCVSGAFSLTIFILLAFFLF